MQIPVEAHELKPGDQFITGEVVINVGKNPQTPRGKVDLTLQHQGLQCRVTWGKHIRIWVERKGGKI